MSGQCLCKEVFKRNHLAIAFALLFAVHSPSVLAGEHVQMSGQHSDMPHVASQDSDAQNPATKVKGFTMKENAFNFPSWPEKKVVAKDVSPPPPLGPYMSTALNNEQTGKPRFTSMMSIPVPNFDEVPMTAFSPDLPWPDDNNVNRWAPEKGYTFVAPTVRPPQLFSNPGNGRYQGNTKLGRMNPQYPQGRYLRPPMPASMYNRAINNRPMNNGSMMRAPNINYSGANYSGTNAYAPGNQLRRNSSMQQRNLPINQPKGGRNFSNAMGRYPQAHTGYNRPAYGATRSPQMMPPSGNHR